MAAKKKQGKSTKAKGAASDEIKQSARRIWLAGLGALAVAEAEGSKVFKKLVKQGEAFEERTKPTVDELKGKARNAKDKATDGWRKLENAVEEKVSSALESAGVPRQHHIDSLRDEVAALKAELEQLRRAKKSAKKAAKKAARPRSKPARGSAAKKSSTNTPPKTNGFGA